MQESKTCHSISKVCESNKNSTTLPPAARTLFEKSPHGGRGSLDLPKHFIMRWDTNLSQKLRDLAAANGSTLNTLIQCAWAVCMHWFSNTDDAVFGAVVSGRPPELENVETMIGLFINTIPVRITSHPGMTFNELLQQTQARASQSAPYDHFPLADIQALSPLKQQLITHILIFENFPMSSEIKKGNQSKGCFQITGFRSQTNYDFAVIIEPAESIGIKFQFNASIYEEKQVQALAAHLTRIVETTATIPQVRLQEIDALSEAERTQLLYDFNNSAVPFAQDKTVHSLFEEQAEKAPDSIILVGVFSHGQTRTNTDNLSVTYSQLDRHANEFAQSLITKGMGADTIAAVMIERSVEMIIGILGILKAGAAYLPIDPAYPQERIDYMMKDSNARILINKFEGPQNSLQHSAFDIPRIQHSNHLAYIIYTSGSTGLPKGVAVEHGQVVNTLLWRKLEYSLDYRDKVLQLFSFSFDGFVTSFFTPVISGAPVVLLPGEGAGDAMFIKRVIAVQGVTHFIAVPSFYGALLETAQPQELKSLRIITLAGEAVSTELVLKSKQACPGCELVNEYGATENSVAAAFSRNLQPAAVIPIGRPIANTSIYILDRYQRLLPIGAAGEICIAGAGISRGYLNRPELTRGSFEKPPAGTDPVKLLFNYFTPLTTHHSPIYHTGDLGRRMFDGSIEFLGRIDEQVKVRGFRVELGEIEHRLNCHPAVKEAAVIVSNAVLCAYVTIKDDIEPGNLTNQLRDYLQGELPSFMVPAFFTMLADMPRGIGGKIDKKALPLPAQPTMNMTDGEYLPPQDEIEMTLARLWSEILAIDVEKISITQDFFHLGGHSLYAMQLAAAIHRETGIEIPLAQLFKTPTIRDMAQYIRQGRMKTYQSILPVEKREYYPASSAQKRLYFLHRMEKSAALSYNIPTLMTIEGPLDIPHLQQTFRQLIRRHEILRTSFITVGEEPAQKISSHIDFDFKLNGRGDPMWSPNSIEHFVRPFDLSQAPLMRVELVKIEEEKHLLMLDMHHIICDGASMGIFINEFVTLYDGEELAPLRIQYKDYAYWQQQAAQEEKLKSRESYWLNLLAGELPVLNLIGDYPRPLVQSFAGDRTRFRLNPEDTALFHGFTSRCGVTPYMNLLATFYLLLYRYTNQEDIIIGGGIAGRSHADVQDIMGMFVNMLALRNTIHGSITYSNFLQEIKKRSLAAFENQDMPFEELVEKLQVPRDASRNPVFDVTFVLQNFQQPQFQLKDLVFSPYPYENKTAKFDLTLFANERDGMFYFSIEYCTALFTRCTIEQMGRHYLAILREIMAAPDQVIDAIDILSQDEKEQLLYAFNNSQIRGQAKLIDDVTVLYPIRAITGQAKFRPDVPAVIAGDPHDEYYTYRTLTEKANQLAHYLIANHVQLEDRIAILLAPGAGRIISLLGILKAGAAFVPIDPSLPEERIKTIIRDAGCHVLISQKKYLRLLNSLQWECEALTIYLCLDSLDIVSEEEEEKNRLMDEELWGYVGETARDDITGGGWSSSFTGEAFSPAEMAEYGDNVLKKLLPLLHPEMRVLEIGCATGLTMYRIAPLVGFYYGTDLSQVIIQKNRERVQELGMTNIELACMPAHQVSGLKKGPFDLVIINSVIQCFHGHNYLRNVIRSCVGMIKPGGFLFVGDVMDLEAKKRLIHDLETFKQANAGKGYKTKTDFSAELFVSRRFFQDLSIEIPAIAGIEFSNKIHIIENELTRYRYDVLMHIAEEKITAKLPAIKKHKYQHDALIMSQFPVSISQREQDILPAQLAYVIYTSGTTGKPRGVMIQHRSLANLCTWHNRYYRVTGQDRATHYAGFGFDAAVWEIFPYLTAGAALYIIPGQIRLDPRMLNQYFERHRITIAFLPTQLCEQFMELENTSLTRLLTGGDKLNVFMSKNYRLYNNYGPTENTVVTSVFPVREYTANIPIGKPIDNTYVYILHPQAMTLQPMGAPGELCIAGVGLARGYMDDPELTRGSFEKPPAGTDPVKLLFNYFSPLTTHHSPLYHTGDLARWVAQGDIEFLGRIDRQVKIRGYRIELEEISSRLLKLGKIKEAVVLQHTGADNQSYLRAYIVASNDEVLVEDEIKEKLALQLPAYMVPDHIVVIDAIPLTANGKVDRKALAHIASETGNRAYLAPRDSFERKLAELWAHVLHVPYEHIGIDADFFQLGGHSLRAAALSSHIPGHFNMSIPLVEIFARPILSDMAAYIKNAALTTQGREEIHEPIPAVEKKEYYTLSAAQERFYFLQQVEPESTGYNAPIILEVTGKLDPEKLGHAFQVLIDRHESFRTSFELVAETPVQKIKDRLKFKIEYTEMNSRRGDPLWSPDSYKNFIRPFDLSQAPLLRIELLKVAEDKHILMLDMHHIISDGSTLNIIINELKSVYEGRVLPPLQIQYKDFALWQTSPQHREEIRRQETYWLETFAGELPVLNLPLDFPRGPLQDKTGEVIIARAGRTITRAAKALEKQTGATLFMILMAVFNTLLMRYTEAEDIIAGTLLAGRPHRDLEPIAGAFITGVAMRNFPAATKPFSFFLQEVKENSLAVFSNQEYPFEELYEKIEVNRALNRNPLFDVMLIVQNMERTEFTLEGLRFTPLAAGKENVNYDLQISAAEVQDDIHFKLLYAVKLFRPSFIERMGRHLTCLLEDAARHPDKTLAHLEMLTSAEKQQVLETFNDTEQPFPMLTVNRLFEQQAERTPGSIAVIAGHRFVTYRQLDREANVCAGHIKAMGIVPGHSLVGFMTGRSLEMMVGILGILKTGAAYLPLEPSLPVKRLQHILEQAEPSLLVIHRPLKETAERIVPPGKTIPFLYCEDMALGESVPVSFNSACDLTATIYIFFTSGTTGTARGIRTIHMNIATYIHAFCHLFSLKETDRTLQQSSIAFDAFAEETFAIFTVGGTVVMPRDEEIKDPEALRALVMSHGITILSCSPLMINEFNKRAPMPSLHTIASGTDVLKKEYYTKIINHTHIYNLYGPTETTVCATSYACTGEEESSVPIGRPLANYRVYILDRHDNPVPIGIPGEIYIGGPGVSEGYLNRPELTAEKFKKHRFYRSNRTYISFYRTGDTGRWLEDGNIEFFSRIDHQVKIRGYRIELGEIESRLLKHPQVSGAVVINRKDKEGDNYLCAYIVPVPLPGEDRPLTVPVLRTYLLEYLPEYMVPSYYIVLDAIPMSANGKVDRRQLPELTTVYLSGQTYEPPANEHERILINIWAELLNREPEKISVTDNFFDIGGHSLKGMNLIARVHKSFQVHIPLSAIFRHPTIREMAAYIKESHFSKYSEIPALPLKEYYPVSKTQQWMYIVSRMLRPGQYGYNTPFGIIFEGEFETGRLQDIFLKLIARHEAFRTSFMILPAPAQTTNVKEEELLVQRIHAAEDIAFQLEHYRLDKEPEPGPETVEKILGVFREFVRPFDLRRPPLLRAGLLEIGPRRYMLMIDMHHIITDGSSTVIFSHDFTVFYRGGTLPPLRIQYKEYAVWKNNLLQSNMMKQKIEYWKNIFSGPLPVLELPHDFPRPAIQDFSGDTVSFLVSPAAYRALQELAQKTGTTLFMALLAIHSLLMMKYSGSEDIIIGTVMAGRPHADLAEVIGAFITILALRIKPRKDKTFNNFLQEVKRHCLDAFENQDYPFDSLLETLDYKRNPSRSALFDTMIQVQNMEQSQIPLEGLDIKPFEQKRGIADFDLELNAMEARDRLILTMEFQTALFRRETIERMMTHYEALILQCAAQPGKTLAEIDIFTGSNQWLPLVKQEALTQQTSAMILPSGTEYIPPTNETEKKIIDQWAAVLEIPAGTIGIQDNFFDLGGNSIKALHLMSLNNQAYTLLDIFDYSTPEKLAAWIDSDGISKKNHKYLISLTPGLLAPSMTLIGIPFAGGTVSVYKALADELLKKSDSVAVYALSLPGHDFHREVKNLEQWEVTTTAMQCLEEIKKTIHTPIVIWGHCAGSALAVEITRLMEKEELPVKFVFIGADFIFAGNSLTESDSAELEKLKQSIINVDIDESFQREIIESGELSREELETLKGIVQVDGEASVTYYIDRLSTPTDGLLKTPLYNMLAADDPMTNDYEQHYQNWYQLALHVELLKIDRGGHLFIRDNAAETAGIILEIIKGA